MASLESGSYTVRWATARLRSRSAWARGQGGRRGVPGCGAQRRKGRQGRRQGRGARWRRRSARRLSAAAARAARPVARPARPRARAAWPAARSAIAGGAGGDGQRRWRKRPAAREATAGGAGGDGRRRQQFALRRGRQRLVARAVCLVARDIFLAATYESGTG